MRYCAGSGRALLISRELRTIHHWPPLRQKLFERVREAKFLVRCQEDDHEPVAELCRSPELPPPDRELGFRNESQTRLDQRLGRDDPNRFLGKPQREVLLNLPWPGQVTTRGQTCPGSRLLNLPQNRGSAQSPCPASAPHAIRASLLAKATMAMLR